MVSTNHEPESPTELRSKISMTVRALDTRKLIKGRPSADGKSAIIGLFGFADRLRVIWDGAKLSDPYALWWLLRVEKSYTTAVNRIEFERASIRQQFTKVQEFDIEFPAASALCRVELSFACPYAYWGARLLSNYDELVLAATTAKRLGVLPKSTQPSNRFQCERAIRGLFASPLGYHSLGVTFDDIEQRTTLAEEARTLMGDLPADILNRQRTPMLLVTDSESAAVVTSNPS